VLKLVPEYVLQALAAGRRTGSFEAGALFLDIAGFTALTERCMVEGPTGAEALSELLDEAFGPLVAAVHDEGGFVATFAGDAFTALFPAAPSGAVAAARACLDRFAPLGTREGLSLRVGVGCGHAAFTVVGTDRLTAVYRGTAIDRAVAAEHACAPGEIRYAPGLTPVPMPPRHSCSRSVRSAIDRSLLARFATPDLLRRRPGGEFRTVVSCFLSFDPPAADDDLQAFLTLLVDLLDDHGGHMGLIDFGDKGAMCFALFGAPQAHEDDDRRALAFVAALRAAATVPMAAGLTRGCAYAGTLGSRERCTYTALGRTVNLAARLMGRAAPGQTLLDETLAARVAAAPLGPQPYKGFAAPVPTFCVVEDDGAVRRRTATTRPLVGRRTELDTALAHLAPLFDGRSVAPLAVTGPAGIGKSRFAEALAAHVSDRGGTALTLPCDGILGLAYHPFAEGLRKRFGLHGRLAPQAARNVFVEVLPDEPDHAPFLADLCGFPLDAAAAPAPQARRQALTAAVVALCRRSCRHGPLLVTVEDAHWLDDASRDLLVVLVRSLADEPCAVVTLWRTAGPDDRPSLDLPGRPDVQLRLERLTTAAIGTLIRDTCGARPTAALAKLVAGRSEGNPFCAVQLLRWLDDRGALRRDGDRCDVDPAGGHVPASIASVVVGRLDRQEPALRRLATLAAVAGRTVSSALLHRLVPRADVPALLALGQDEGFWTCHGSDDLTFGHALIHDALYEMQLLRDRRRRHRNVARALAAQAGDDGSDPPWAELARHYELAELAGPARRCLERAAQQARSAYRLTDAAALYGRLLAHRLPAHRAAATALALGDALEALGRLDEAAERYDQALTSAGRNRRRRAAVLLHQGRLQHRRGATVDGEGLVERALALYRRCGDDGALVEPLSALAGFLADRGDADTARHRLAEAARVARRRRNRPQLLRILRQAAGLDAGRGLLARAQRRLERILARLGSDGNDGLLLECSMSLGGVRQQLSDYDGAEIHYRRAFELARRMGFRAAVASSLGNLGVIEWIRGDFERAQTHYEADYRLQRDIGDRAGEAVAAGFLGGIHQDRGCFAQALAWYDEQLTIAREVGAVEQQAFVQGEMGYCHGLQGTLAEALDYLSRSIDLCRRHDIGHLLAWYLHLRGATHWRRGDGPSARRDNDEALALARDRNLRNALQRSIVLDVTLRHAAGELGVADAEAALLDFRAGPTWSAYMRAYAAEALYRIAGQRTFGELALTELRSLVATRPDIEYQQHIAALETDLGRGTGAA